MSSTKLSRKKLFLLSPVFIIALLLLMERYPAMHYRGDGNIWGDPLFGYSIAMKQFGLNVSGDHVYHFAGTPEKEWTLRLYAEGGTTAQRQLTLLHTRLTASLLDEKGRLVCHADGFPGETENDWQLDEAGSYLGTE